MIDRKGNAFNILESPLQEVTQLDLLNAGIQTEDECKC